MANTTRTKVETGVTGVGFKYMFDKSIEGDGWKDLVPTKANDLAGKIIFTANGIVLDGYLVAEPNGALESSFQQAMKDLDAATIFKGAVVKAYIKGTTTTTPSTIYSDSACTTAITGNSGKLYYIENTNSLLYYVAGLSKYCAVSDVYAELNTALTTHKNDKANPHGVTKTQVGLGNVDNTADKDKSVKSATSATNDSAGNKITDTYTTKDTFSAFFTEYESFIQNPTSKNVATLDSSGKVPSSQLPSYVDDVLEYTSKSKFPSTGETGKIYVDTTTNLTYRWSGTSYVEISASLALGETSSTAYAGDKGKAIRTDLDSHIANKNNPHGVTASQVGLGNVDNTADSDKVVKGAAQDGSGNNIVSTYLRKDAVESSSLSGKSTTEVPSVSLVYNETAKIWTGTQAEYDALTSYDPRTAYLITDPDIVYSDLNFGRYIAASSSTVASSAENYEIFKLLYDDGYKSKKEVYMKCYYGSSDAGKDGYHLIQYQGAATYNNETYQVFSCLYGEVGWIRVGFKMSGTTAAEVHVFSDGNIVTTSELVTTVSSDSDNRHAATAAAVYNAVNSAKTDIMKYLTWE